MGPAAQVQPPVLARLPGHRPSHASPAAARRTCRRPSPRPRAWCTASRRTGCPGWRFPRSRRPCAVGRQACGLPAATTLMAAIIVAASVASSGQRRTAFGPACGVPQRKRLPRLQHLVGEFGRVRRLPRERRRLAMTPRQPLAPLLGRPDRRERLGAADQRQVQLAPPHRLRGPVHQILRSGPADARVEPMARRGAERGRQSPDGVVVGPALAVQRPAANRYAAEHLPARQRRRPHGPAAPS